MSETYVQGVISNSQPRGMKRLLLLLLAQFASDDGLVEADDGALSKLATAAAMRADRFDRILQELQEEGFVSDESSDTLRLVGRGGGGSVGCKPGEQQEAQLGLAEGLQPSAEIRKAVNPRRETEEKTDRIWAYYVETFDPRGKKAGPEERRIIRMALDVATEQECLTAIAGNKASAFHQGSNDRAKKYNKLSHILKGKRGGRTTREQIDYFLDTAEKQTVVGGMVLSADPGTIAAKKELVRRGHRFSTDGDAVNKAQEAEEWLTRHGIITQRRPSDGYPIWPSGGVA